MNRMTACMMAVLFSVVGCASGNPPNPDPVSDAGPISDSGPVGDSGPYPDPYADAGPGTCVGNCGSWDPDTLCACDTLCEHYDDCCPDKKTVCEPSELSDAGPGEFPVDAGPEESVGSCEGYCGTHNPEAGCWCDNVCVKNGDCCEDAESVCDLEPTCEDHPRCHPGVTGESTHCSKYHKTVQECKDIDGDGCLELRQKKMCAEGKECVSTAEYEGGDTVAYCAPKKPEPKECKKSWKKRVCFSAGKSGKEVCVCVPKHVGKKWDKKWDKKLYQEIRKEVQKKKNK